MRGLLLGISMLGLLAAVGSSIPAGAQPTPSAPTSCAATVSGSTFNISWPAASGATEYLVHRSVNSSPFYWRARVSTVNHLDSTVSGNVVYRVTSITADGTRSAPTTCGGGAPVQRPTSCVVIADAGAFGVTWEPVDGASEFIVRRSVNNSSMFWRGRPAGTEFDDSYRAGSVVYTVTSLGDNGTVSDSTTCDSDLEPTAPATCSVVSDAAFDVVWAAADGAATYVVERSIDGSRFWWRNRIAATSYQDSFRPGEVQYRVISVGADGSKSASTLCAAVDVPQPAGRYLAIGDMANCNLTADTEVGLLLDRLDGPIIGLGDYAYTNGSVEDFNNCFTPPFGRHTERFHPVVGNHEYYTANATPYFNYFGAAAGDPTKGYYAETDGDWELIYLNSNCDRTSDCNVGSGQYQWLQTQLAAAPAGSCRAIVLHHPRWSSWGPYADQAFLDPIFQLLDGYEIDLVLNGHAHHYERLAKLNANGVADTSGFVQFTVGTGGTTLRQPAPADVLAASESLLTTDSGVLALQLDSGSYSWEFISTTDAVLDSGTNTCNN